MTRIDGHAPKRRRHQHQPKPRLCPWCHGTGVLNSRTCPACRGTCYVH